MTSHLQHLLDLIRQSEKLSDADKAAIEKAVKEADKAFEITNFKLDRTEKVKRTTAILLEETIAELEQKRKAVEAQSRELEIETAVERVRADAMAMHSTNDFEKVSQQLLKQVKTLNLEGFTGASICLIDENQFMSWWDFSSPGNIGDPKSQSFRYDAKKFKILGLDVLATWQQGESYMLLDFDLEKLHAATKEWEEINIDVANTFKKVISEGKLTHQWNPSGRLSKGFLTFDMLQPPTEDVRKITIKMAHAFDQAYTRFLDLQKAEAQARESQIQLAMERVRARTMAMHHSSELADTAKILFQQIKELGYEMWSCGFGIWRPEVDLEEAWMSTGDLFPIILIPFREDPTHLSIYKAAQRGESVFEVEVKGEVLTRHYDWLMSQPSFKIVFGQIENSGIILPKVQWKYAAFFKQGYLHLITTQPQPDIHDISSRFAKVFEQTYTRFLDLQKAEAQARESQIQLALERVRARTMAMHKSEELTEVAVILYKELRSLGVTQEFFECGYMEIDQVNKIQRGWMTGPDGNLLEPFNLPLTGEPVFDSRYEAWKQQTPVFHQVVAGEQLKRHLEFAIPYFDSKEAEEIARTQVPGSIVFYCGNFSHGYLAINCGLLLDAEAESLIARFTRVFEMTYLRFLDLKKAEAQAREALIEASLERVRSRAMAMQHSVELSSLISVVYAELTKLDVTFDRCFIMMFDTETNGATWWMASPEAPELSRGFKLPYHEYGPHLAYLQGWKERKEKWEYVAEGEVKRNWDDYIFSETELSSLPEAAKAYMKSVPRVCLSASFNTFGCLTLGSNEPLTDEAFSVLVRFARVFEICYTRFNDLKQAEAQAKEAQIEAALERVRSRTMGMQKSEELRDVIQIIYEQFLHLKIPIDGAGFAMDYMESDDFNFWLADTSSAFPYQVHIPYFDHPQFNRYKEAKEKGLDFYTSSLTCEERNGFFDHISQYIPIPQELKKVVHSAPGYETSHVVLKNVILYILNFSGLSFSDADNATLLRFGKVFEQTYTRFNDLKQAEAQAREAQIEVALERVRSRSMAMQKSEELAEVIKVTFDQLLNLNINIDTAGFNLELRETDDWNLWVADRYNSLPSEVHIPYFDDPLSNAIIETKNKGLSLLEISLTFEEKNKMWAECFKVITVPEEGQKQIFNSPGYHMSMVFMQRVGLYIQNYDGIPYKAEDNATLLRFGKMFEQTYIRFNDLKQAEAQARESQIQLALERVRARTMAMQRSEELPEVAALLFQQVKTLGVPQFHCGFNIFEIDDKECIWYPGSADGDILPPCKIPLTEHPVFMAFNESRKRGDELFVYEKEGEYQAGHYRYMLSLPVLGEILQNMLDAGIPFPTFQIDHLANFSHGNLLFITSEHFPEMHDTFKRFAKVFEQTYTRFLDLQKAEAQAREAQIEASLERVRTQAMAMHKADDLLIVSEVLYKELKTLGIDEIRNAMILIHYEKKEFFLDYDYSSLGGKITQIPYKGIPQIERYIKRLKENEKNNEGFLELIFSDEEFESWKDARKATGQLDDPRLGTLHALYYYHFNMGPGDVSISTFSPLQKEKLQVLERFRNVFKLPYQRYLDIELAATQAREAQIEAALERVRSASLAMHHSSELNKVVTTLLERLIDLGISFNASLIWTFDREKQSTEIWIATPVLPDPVRVQLPYDPEFKDNLIVKKFWHSFEKGEDALNEVFTGNIKNQYFECITRYNDEAVMPQHLRELVTTLDWTVSYAAEKNSLVGIDSWSDQKLSDEEFQILKRVARVFEQAYVRFLDLQKAEANAREANIEAALEKVRGKAMAMHNSNDLIATAGVLFAELRKLGIITFRCGVGLLNKENRKTKLYSATTTGETDNLPVVGWALLEGHEVLTEMYERWLRNEDYFPVLNGELLKTYYEKINPTFTVPVEQTAQYEQHGFFLPFSEGLFYGWAEQPFIEGEVKILQRFKAIVDLTFRRYMELQKSEEVAREAVRSASLDRVRAEIASMRTVQDLDRITPLIWRELTTLGITFVRCGVFIMDEEKQIIHTFLSTPDGKAIAAFHLPYGSTTNLADAIKGWRTHQRYVTRWTDKDFQSQADLLVQQGSIATREQYLSTIPKEGIYLHFLPFLQGMLYVGHTAQLHDNDLNLIQSVADAFSTAYARYEDFNKLEAAKKQVDKTLTDLRQTQQQLVQSEKMASLGELTAGIAHEIQNPLNFVNNFSEVSNELLKDLQDIRRNSNVTSETSEEDELLKNIAGNLEKINHHGKRAADIVKGMLQHSRTSTGQKELTDINTVAEEYLRLAYHGLRAKDKSFNARFETNLDPTLPKLNVIPQDIGRVLLNMINNAFYAVSEKSSYAKASEDKYEPTVIVSTKNLGNTIEISVKDNGNGIPDSIKDKIFQPFFTTKPTGQGTGLGLSLSYEIVKAHGGELLVETKENEGLPAGQSGSIFTIQIPIS